MAAVALNSLQPNALSGSAVDIPLSNPMPLRTSRTDPSIASTARQYPLFSEQQSPSATDHHLPHRLSTSAMRDHHQPYPHHPPASKARQRPHSTRDNALISKRLRPDPQPSDHSCSPVTSGRFSDMASPNPSASAQHPPLPKDLYRNGRRRHYRNASMVTARENPINNPRVKRPPHNLRHERAASLGSASNRPSAHFSLSDFSLGKVLGAGGTATVIRAELITPHNALVRERVGLAHNETPAGDSASYDLELRHAHSIHNTNTPNNSKTRRRLSERSPSMDTDVGAGSAGDTLLSAMMMEGKIIDFALKVVQKKALSRRALHYLTREIMIHREVQSHKNVVSLYDVFEDGAAIYLVQELLKGGDLYSALKRERAGIPESTALQIADQILQALSYMHKHGFAHRDIKPENIMFAERPALGEGRVGTVKLIDLGLACARDPKAPVRERTSAEKCGTIRYAAPEVVTDASYIPELADVWSVGVVLYSAIAHRNPFCGKTEKDVLEQIENGGPPFEGKEWAGVSNDTIQLIGRLLCRKPADRPSAQQALRIVRQIVATLGSSSNSSNNINDEVTAHDNGSKDSKENGDQDTNINNTNSNKSGDERPHTPNIFDGILALFNGNSKESSS